MSEERVENLIILGGGPAGYTAALYAARANLEPLVIEGFQWGGQLQNTTDVENYPGYPEGIMGPEMMNEFRAQAERFGTRFITDDADRVELSDGGHQRVFVGDDEYVAKAIILAMGAEPRRLGIPGELELGGRGVSTCGVCDGAFFKGEDVVVIGGGDSAMEDSIFISKYADKLTSVHRRDEYRASKIMLDRAREQGNIDFKTPYVPEEFIAGDDGKLRAVRLRNAETGETEELEVGGAFVAIGHIPRSELVAEQVDVDDEGYVLTEGKSTRTNVSRRVRGRRPRRPHLPPGGDRRRHRLHGRARRRVVPARHPALARGALAAEAASRSRSRPSSPRTSLRPDGGRRGTWRDPRRARPAAGARVRGRLRDLAAGTAPGGDPRGGGRVPRALRPARQPRPRRADDRHRLGSLSAQVRLRRRREGPEPLHQHHQPPPGGPVRGLRGPAADARLRADGHRRARARRRSTSR